MKFIPFAALAAAILTAQAASAASGHRFEEEHRLVFADGARATARTLTRTLGGETRAAFERFAKVAGPTWRAEADASTGALARAYGRGLEHPGSVASAAVAERAARALLEAHVALFAPGASVTDFVVAANVMTDGLRTVSFFQRHRGMEVVGGQLSFRFKNDRMFMVASEAVPDVRADRPSRTITDDEAAKAAIDWIRRDLDVVAAKQSVTGPVVLAVPTNEGRTTHVAMKATVRSTAPHGRWDVYVDARTGAPIARRQTLMFASGSIYFNAPERRPGDTRTDFPAGALSIEVDGARMTTAEDGSFTWAGDQPARIRVFPQGTNVNVINASGFTASVAFSLESGGRYTWNDRSAELRDAQVTTYVASRRAIEHGKTIAPAMRWLSTNRLAATVNIDDVCNAFSDGDTINFFRSGQGCENTGRLPDVIYHEFGHAFHYHALIPGAGNFDTALSEGASDYYAASITGDPATARGFFFDDQPLRDIDPVGTEARWPDGISFDPHETGLIFAGAMWDLRKALIAELGTEAGIAKTHEIFLGVLARATDIPSSFGEALASADDDGDLSNGTPNYCAIYEAFARHGLAETGINPPMTWDNNIYLGVPDGVTCPGAAIASARIHWEIRGEPGSGGTVDMELVGTEWTTRLPDDRKNVVLRFQMELTLGDGSIARFPQNAADPRYEMYVGAVTPLYCTDFETDPLAEGWAHGPLGGAPAEGDDWELGTPRAVFGSGDPNAARSGTQVMGNDLGSGDNDGRYARGASSALTSPVISTNGYSIVRLQYWRWLNVEDSQSDQARIVGNGQPLWTNASAGNPQAPLNHLDSEWVFHDVDLSPVVADDQVQVAFELTANMRRRFGGWTIDDVCVVGVTVCGNGAVEPGETCDDGNLTDGDGCEASCAPTPPAVCGNGRVEQGESCDDGNVTDGDGCQASCTPTPAPVCGNGVVEQGEACDDGVLDGTACAAGCVAVLETDDGGCGCTTSTHATSRSSLALFGLFALLGLARARRR